MKFEFKAVLPDGSILITDALTPDEIMPEDVLVVFGEFLKALSVEMLAHLDTLDQEDDAQMQLDFFMADDREVDFR